MSRLVNNSIVNWNSQQRISSYTTENFVDPLTYIVKKMERKESKNEEMKIKSESIVPSEKA